MLISKINHNFKISSFKDNVRQKQNYLQPLKCDTFTFSGKIERDYKKPQLKEKTIYIFLGPPASGKGTQAKKLAYKLNIAHISTGDLLREEIKKETKLGMEAKTYMDNGELVPTELFERILIDRISQDDCKNGYILDGFPRTKEQAELIDEINKKDNAKIKVIQLEVNKDKLIERMSSRAKHQNRTDDTIEKLETRIDIYNNAKDILIDYYGNKVVNIDANGDIWNVKAQIDKSIQEDLA